MFLLLLFPSDYHMLVAELKKWFIPVQLTAVQTQLFHDRKQGPEESVDEFAQDLRKLYSKAYAGFTKGTPEAEKVGQTVLASQFVAGLRPRLQSTVVGMEGGLDQLVLRARFEEAKRKELAASRPAAPAKPTKAGTNSGPTPSGTPRRGERSGANPRPSGTQQDKTNKCYNCGMEGHYARDCTYPKQNKKDVEAKGKKKGAVTNLKEAGEDSDEIGELRQRLRELEMKAALNQMASLEGEDQSCLGPTVFVDVIVNGVKTAALVDTGSPATIISLDYVMKILASQRDPSIPVKQWKEQILQQFSPPDVALKSYGGHRVDLVSQTVLQLALGGRQTNAIVLVQKGAPNDLLLGTDTQPKLGIALVIQSTDMLTQTPVAFGELQHRQLQENPGSRPSSGLPGNSGRQQFPRSQESSGRQEDSGSQEDSRKKEDPKSRGDAGRQEDTGSPVKSNSRRDSGSLDDPRPWPDPGSQSGSGPQDNVEDSGSQDNSRQLDGPVLPDPPLLYPQGQNITTPNQKPSMGDVEATADRGGGAPPVTGVVRLLQTIKVPAGFKKIVRGHVRDAPESLTTMLFTPSLELSDVRLADGVVECGGQEVATLIIENHGTAKLRLKRGVVLGVVEAVAELGGLSETETDPVPQPGPGEGESTQENTTNVNPIDLSVHSRRPTEGGEPIVSSIEGERTDRLAKLFRQLELDDGLLNADEEMQLRTVLEHNADIFAVEPSELGTSSITQHSIKTGEHSPIRQPLRRMPFTLRPQVDKLVQEMLDQGVVQPSSSPWASPVVLVRKKDGTMRFCVDYRRLNSVTKLDEFPLPRIDDTLDILAGARYFTALDMASGYWQVAMEPSSVERQPSSLIPACMSSVECRLD